ncbi:hypothetical protein GCM10027572_26890 [Flexivirga lutea]
MTASVWRQVLRPGRAAGIPNHLNIGMLLDVVAALAEPFTIALGRLTTVGVGNSYQQQHSSVINVIRKYPLPSDDAVREGCG